MRVGGEGERLREELVLEESVPGVEREAKGVAFACAEISCRPIDLAEEKDYVTFFCIAESIYLLSVESGERVSHLNYFSKPMKYLATIEHLFISYQQLAKAWGTASWLESPPERPPEALGLSMVV